MFGLCNCFNDFSSGKHGVNELTKRLLFTWLSIFFILDLQHITGLRNQHAHGFTSILWQMGSCLRRFWKYHCFSKGSNFLIKVAKHGQPQQGYFWSYKILFASYFSYPCLKVGSTSCELRGTLPPCQAAHCLVRWVKQKASYFWFKFSCVIAILAWFFSKY